MRSIRPAHELIPFSVEDLARAIETGCPHVVFALLHGSAREGIVGPRSDVDIAVFTDGDAVYQVLMDVTDAARAVVGIDEIDVGILNHAEPVYRFEALKGRLLFTRDRDRYETFFSLTCREYEEALIHYERQWRYRLGARGPGTAHDHEDPGGGT